MFRRKNKCAVEKGMHFLSGKICCLFWKCPKIGRTWQNLQLCWKWLKFESTPIITMACNPAKLGWFQVGQQTSMWFRRVPVKAARACLGAPPCLVDHLQYKIMPTVSHGIPWPKQAAMRNASKFRLRFTHEKTFKLRWKWFKLGICIPNMAMDCNDTNLAVI